MSKLRLQRPGWRTNFFITVILLVCFCTVNLFTGICALADVPSKSAKTDLVNLKDFIPDIIIDMRYAGTNNVFGTRIYDNDTAYLRRGTAEKLRAVQSELAPLGYRLKVWDAYRPPSAQFKLWKICPDARFVANPNKGFSNHSRGVSVDLTLLDQNGNELEMPSGFDDFSTRADRNYSDVSKTGSNNAQLLTNVMVKHGFQTISTEWWHFDDNEKSSYDVVKDLPKELKEPVFEDWREGNYRPAWAKNNQYSFNLINQAIKQGLIRPENKDGSYYLHMNKKITRAEFAVMLAMILNLDIQKDGSTIWYEPYTTALINSGIIDQNDWEDDRSNELVTRMDIARWVGRVLLVNGFNLQNNVNITGELTIPLEKVAVEAGIIGGDGRGNYDFNNTAAKVDVTIILMRLQQVLQMPEMQYTEDYPLAYAPVNIYRDITISAIGDCTLGTDSRYPKAGRFDTVFNNMQRNYGYFFKNVIPVLANDDLTIANLETTFTTANQKANKSHQDAAFWFKADPSYVQILLKGSVEAANLANNHSFDYLQQGYQDTINCLEKKGISHFGYDKKTIYSVKGIDIGMLGYNALGAVEEGVAWPSLWQNVLTDIKGLKDSCDLVIVSFHWGIEKSSQVTKEQVDLAHLAIDSGADLVLGHHPHVIQKLEKYRGKYILYSLGNFCYGGNNNPKDKDTFIFQQTFVFDEYNQCVDASKARVIPCSVSSIASRNNYCPTPLTNNNDIQRVLGKLTIPKAEL